MDRGILLDLRHDSLADIAFAKHHLGDRPDEFANLRRDGLDEHFRLEAPLLTP